MKIQLRLFPIDQCGRMRAGELLEIGGSIYGRLNDILAVEEIGFTTGDKGDMTQEHWDIHTALDRTNELWLNDGDDQIFCV